jgi:hypothetical protein
MKAILVLTIAMTGFIAQAQSIILGEYSGAANLNVSTSGNGFENSYVNSCKMAYNLDFTSQKLNMDFGVVECARGLDTWNENPVELTIQNGKIFNNGTQVGSLDASGAAVFKMSSFKNQTYQVQRLDMQCQFLNFETKQIKVGQELTFTIKKISETSYQLSRKEYALQALNTYRKDYPNCPAIADYTEGMRQSDFNVLLKK